jgi:hypothetical protein
MHRSNKDRHKKRNNNDVGNGGTGDGDVTDTKKCRPDA